MFRAIILPIFRNTRLCYSLWYNAPTMLPVGHRPATSWVQPIGTILRFHESKSLNPEDGTESFPETPLRNYHYSLRNNPGQRISLPHNLFVNVYRKLLWFAMRTSSTFVKTTKRNWIWNSFITTGPIFFSYHTPGRSCALLSIKELL